MTTRKDPARPAARAAPRRSPGRASAAVRTPRQAPAGGAARTAPRARMAPSAKKARPVWYRRIDAARVALAVVLVALALCAALVLDIYLGKTDPVHMIMVNAFGPLAFLVPVGAGLLVFDFYRRHEGRRSWLRFEESCGAILLFVAVLTVSSLAGLSYSLVGNSLVDEMAGVIGRPGALVAVVLLLAIGLVLAFRVTVAQASAASHGLARMAMAASHGLARMAMAAWRVAGGLVARRQQGQVRPAKVAAQDEARKRRSRREDAESLSDRPSVAEPAPPVPAREPVSFTAGRSKIAARKRLPVEDEPLPLPDFSYPAVEDDPEDDESAPAPATVSAWPAPALSLLDDVPPAVAGPANNDARARIIEETLASFNVSAEVVEVQSGPAVTQFGLRPAAGVRVQRITALSNDLALALAASSIRIEAPVPGKPVVGIEIPNGTTALVTLREILESKKYADMKSPLKIALGKNVSGDPVVVDLARMPHLLIAGATGSGKSVCLNSLIACLLFHNSPERLRLLMIDPKMVELTTFNGVPHLLKDVVTDMDKVSGTLKWALKEMHRRYKLFGEAGARNIARFNELQYEKGQRGEKAEQLPYIVFIIDELADLMMVSPAEVEDSISRLAALARATGIHLVLATQRPSVDVITGVIKANFPARIAFAVSSQVDSRTIIDQAGAEKLLGRGDMLYLPSDGSKAMRVQGSHLSDEEIERIVEFWKHNAPYAPEQIPDAELLAPRKEEGENENEDKLLSDATRVVREYRRASVSLLQRRLSIGYSRAARLLDQLEEHGVVGPSEDGKSRIVLDNGDVAAVSVPAAPLPDDD